MVSFDICQNNQGALSFLAEAYAPQNGMHDIVRAERAFQRMQDNDITGVKLYMLWNDCLDRNTQRAIDIMLNNSIEDIKEHINAAGGRGIPYADET